jgi:hypothetical protein
MNQKTILILTIISVVFLCSSLNVFGNKIYNRINLKLTAKDKIQTQDFQISGIYLEQPLDKAIKVLGKPVKELLIPNKDGFHQFDKEEYYFAGIVIKIDKSMKKVEEIRIESKSFKTYRGVGIGDKEKDVYYRYGKLEKLQNYLRIWTNAHTKDDGYYYLMNFLIEKGKVIRINLYYNQHEG